LSLRLQQRLPNGRWQVEPLLPGSCVELLDRFGHIPLPPYIARDDASKDRERYQTVYARERGSVAAPTAGLHFTPEILARLRERGIETAEVTLHVGLGTFQPVRSERVEEHRLHSEAYSISEEAAEKMSRARSRESRGAIWSGAKATVMTALRVRSRRSVRPHLRSPAGSPRPAGR